MFANRWLRLPGGERCRTTWNLVLIVGAVLACGVLAPASASAASNAGGGEANGTVWFDAPGILPGLTCSDPGTPVGHVTGTSTVTIVANTVIKGYVGPVALSGTTVPDCETASTGAGQLTISAQSTDPAPKFVDCPGLVGGYSRVASNVQAQLGGTCTLNNASVPVTLLFHGEFAPDGLADGAGFTQPITSATWRGSFVLLPL